MILMLIEVINCSLLILDMNEDLKHEANETAPSMLHHNHIQNVSLVKDFKTQFYSQMVTNVSNPSKKGNMRLSKDPLRPMKINSGPSTIEINNSVILPFLNKSPKYARSPMLEKDCLTFDKEIYNKVNIMPMRSMIAT
jgi:hypothetical protein